MTWHTSIALSVALSLVALSAGGCDGRVVFSDHRDSGSGLVPDSSSSGGGGSGGSGSGGSSSGGSGGSGSGGSGARDATSPTDGMASVDTAVEGAARDGTGAVDLIAGRDAGPVVCVGDGDCKLAGLHCLTVTGQPGACVECTSNTHCGARRCDLSLNRCVDCLAATAATDCPTGSSHPSICTPVSHRCEIGCEDDAPVCPTAAFQCVDSSHLCVECQVTADCAASPRGRICDTSESVCVACQGNSCTGGQYCDVISGRCVGCRSSKDCVTPALPLCDPATLTCVAVPA